MGYDGQPAATSGVNGGVDNDGRQNVQLIRVHIYWCRSTSITPLTRRIRSRGHNDRPQRRPTPPRR
jgi:hypothetical protein